MGGDLFHRKENLLILLQILALNVLPILFNNIKIYRIYSSTLVVGVGLIKIFATKAYKTLEI